MTTYSKPDGSSELLFKTVGCIRYAQTPLLTLGSERRGIHDVGWGCEQMTGDSHVIAFSLLPIAVEFADESPVLLAPTKVGMATPSRSYVRTPRSAKGQRTIFLRLNAQTVRDSCAIHDASVFDRENPFPSRRGPSSAQALAMAIQLERLMFDADIVLEPMAFEEHALQIVSRTLETVYRSVGQRRATGNDSTNSKHKAKINRAVEMMCNGPAERWSLARIGEAVELSPAYVSRIFRKHTGHTLSQCLQLIRIVHALEQLPDRRHNLIGVALDSGFASHAHMTTSFKRTIGVTPSALLMGDSKAIAQSIECLNRRLK